MNVLSSRSVSICLTWSWPEIGSIYRYCRHLLSPVSQYVILSCKTKKILCITNHANICTCVYLHSTKTCSLAMVRQVITINKARYWKKSLSLSISMARKAEEQKKKSRRRRNAHKLYLTTSKTILIDLSYYDINTYPVCVCGVNRDDNITLRRIRWYHGGAGIRGENGPVLVPAHPHINFSLHRIFWYGIIVRHHVQLWL